MVLAKMVQAAQVRDCDHVLDVGCATGYSSALLARLARSVVALEQDHVAVTALGQAPGKLGLSRFHFGLQVDGFLFEFPGVFPKLTLASGQRLGARSAISRSFSGGQAAGADSL